MQEAGRRTTSRRDLAKHEGFEQISPEVGELDEAAFDEAMDHNPDETLAMLADLTAATDPKLRALAKRLAGRLMLEVSRRGPVKPRGIGKLVTQPYRPDGGDLDLDASIEELVEARGLRRAANPEGLYVRGWAKPGTALCLMIDRSGSMGGRPLATSAVAVAAIAWRAPDDYSVLAFGKDIVVAKSQNTPKSPERVINDVLTLRGFGTTDVAGALQTAAVQLNRSRAGRRIGILLSDCRATVPGDVDAAARGLDELCIIAPEDDDDEARALAHRVGARLVTVEGPSQIPDALAVALGD